ncbi:hypothetical protein DFH09DRAFT_1376151 [Mycena vulgaris]|nr:hypothetical protein DFH09DRAFT_1376151 [Mycena vulgaris]
MDIPSPPRQRVHISTGDLPSPKLHTLAAAHPFTQQLDVLFPASPALQAALSTLDTAYVHASMEVTRALEQERPLTVLSADPHADDAWCVDQHGRLTLHLAAPSYQTLGLAGTRLPFKGAEGHTVSVPADTNTKAKTKLRAWDVRRKEAGLAPWPVLYCAADAASTALAAAANGHTSSLRTVTPQARTFDNLRVPAVALLPRPPATDPAAVEDWEADMRALFEWVGMAGLGAQRLQANDRADAYVAVYAAPPGGVGDVAHLRWRGFLGPAFVQSVIDAVLSTGSPHFAAITAHALPAAPVGYLPPGNGNGKGPARVPRADGEDAWCVLVDGARARWCLTESIGGLDARWG